MPKKVQFAFQGGGARLALLLPVAQAILECEEEGSIKVTHVAGTSAGAIAAALVAGKAKMDPLVEYLRTKARTQPDQLRALFPAIGDGFLAKCKIFFKVVILNRPIASERLFAEFLGRCLRTAGIAPSMPIGEMQIPCTIISTDITTKEHVSVSATVPLLQLLLDSTALPFVFRNHGSKLDGGLVDNLPIDHLTPGPENDRILAVAFEEEAYALPTRGALSLASSLLDAAISSKTRATRRVLGNNYVLSLSADAGDDIVVDSFDIEGFIKFLASENSYKRRVAEAKSWIQRQARQLDVGRSLITLTPKILSRPDEAVKQLGSTFDNIGKISRYYHEQDNIEVIHSAFDVIAFSFRDPSENDRIRITDRFRVTSGSVNIYVTEFFSSNTSQDTISSQFEVLDNQMRPIEFALLEVPRPGKLAKACVIVFAKPLTAGGPDDVFTIIQEQLTPSLMAPLAEHGADYLCTEVVSPTAQRVEMGLAVPAEFGPLVLDDGTADRLRTLSVHIDEQGDLSAPFKSGEQIRRTFRGVPADFETYGWGASNVSRREQVRVLFRRKRRGLTA